MGKALGAICLGSAQWSARVAQEWAVAFGHAGGGTGREQEPRKDAFIQSAISAWYCACLRAI